MYYCCIIDRDMVYYVFVLLQVLGISNYRPAVKKSESVSKESAPKEDEKKPEESKETEESKDSEEAKETEEAKEPEEAKETEEEKPKEETEESKTEEGGEDSKMSEAEINARILEGLPDEAQEMLKMLVDVFVCKLSVLRAMYDHCDGDIGKFMTSSEQQ